MPRKIQLDANRNYDELLRLIDSALDDAKLLVAKSTWLTYDSDPILSVNILLNKLKSEITLSPPKVSEQILRGMHDLGMSAFKDFENSPVEESIGKVTDYLYDEIPDYKFLEPLRGGFSKLITSIIRENQKNQ